MSAPAPRIPAATPVTTPAGAPTPTGLSRGLGPCHTCGLLVRLAPPDAPQVCPRCGAALHARKTDSLRRTTAYLVAAAVLYVPANLLPIMHASTLTSSEDDTIMTGVLQLIEAGSWGLGGLVFFASIVVPMAKLGSLVALLLQVRFRWSENRRGLAQLYRVVEFVGRWSMLDIYVLTLLVALVQLRGLATIEARSGALFFAAVVVLTLLASRAFDPRLLWDNDSMTKERHG